MTATALDWWQATFPRGRQWVEVKSATGRPLRLAWGEIGEGPPLLLMHGIGGWSYGYRQLIGPLSEHYRVICFDLTGHGCSDKPLDSDVTHQGMECAQLIEALCDRPVAVLAQSLGALVALAATLAQPSLISRLVLINVPLFLERLPSEGMRLLASIPLPLVWLVDRLRVVCLFDPWLCDRVKQTRQVVVVNPQGVSDEEVFMLTRPQVEYPGAIAYFARLLFQANREIQCLEHGEPNILSQLQDRLNEIVCPTLVLWGKRDNWFPVAFGEKLVARLPDGQLQLLPGCGHDAANCCPQQVFAATYGFLTSTGYGDRTEPNLYAKRSL
ncbi:putative hydrolase or acyltransferase (alpha/beta hydrolase superfamily) [Rubidibacter lacunae KORDI 51-2]|uniref:Putative hydrolase or acyltransferase (Alpha/beta hydrolase superfamily) n=1 Tax=Rubidibacter lacunae KORDI 51-2 TaxID=582515 RepID=U5DPQ6_9CHRO|nr:alpha/beta hydrolase [Rubidibacter lacunae]ERN41675.1 putative hydrolase or acyltransferase (alpha/beta hydrolase superfamily) [Rubidibacter lacunae KORDI 51-2]